MINFFLIILKFVFLVLATRTLQNVVTIYAQLRELIKCNCHCKNNLSTWGLVFIGCTFDISYISEEHFRCNFNFGQTLEFPSFNWSIWGKKLGRGGWPLARCVTGFLNWQAFCVVRTLHNSLFLGISLAFCCLGTCWRLSELSQRPPQAATVLSFVCNFSNMRDLAVRKCISACLTFRC